MTRARIRELEAEVARLEKVNTVLMDRVERSMDMQGDAFSIFQTAVLLEDRVAERTRELEIARNFLHEAINSIDEGFALYDVDDRLVLANQRFFDMGGMDAGFQGTFEDVLHHLVATNRVLLPEGEAEAWIASRLARHRAPGEPTVTLNSSGIWIQVSERRTGSGGIVSLYTDITGVKAAESLRRQQELVGAVERLTQANTELERFAYVASHDLREPLRTVVSFTQLLERRLGDRPDLKDYMDLIVTAAQRMNALIAGLLDYTGAAARAHPFQRCNLNRSLAAVMETLKPSLTQADAVVLTGLLPTVMADRVQMVQLLQNLLGNAIKYRHPQRPPRIRVEAEACPEGWCLSVADNGIGISQSDQDIYELFRRLHTAHTYPGAGVGLAVCRRIVQRHGGTIWHENNPEGGAIFRFTLPAMAG